MWHTISIMDLFERIKKREAEEKIAKAQKAKKVENALKNADKSFFLEQDEQEDSKNESKDIIINKHLLKFEPKELKTVFVEPEYDGKPKACIKKRAVTSVRPPFYTRRPFHGVTIETQQFLAFLGTFHVKS